MSSAGDGLPIDRQAAWMRLWHVRVSYILQHAGIDHVLIKGSTWCPALDLGHPPTDVDVLLSPGQFRSGLAALMRAGFMPVMDGVDEYEVALHSTPVCVPEGPEVDVHRSFPGLDANPALSWDVLCEGRRFIALGHSAVPILSDELQVLVAAASAAKDGAGSWAARRLSLAVEKTNWEAVVISARRMRADGTLRAGLSTAGHAEVADRLGLGSVPHRFRAHRSPGDRRLEDVLSQPWRRRLPVVMRELWPSAGFLTLTQPGVPARIARRRHLRRLLRQLPGAVARAGGRRVRLR